MIPKLKINDDKNPMVSEIFGKAVITSVVYSLSNMLNATGATNKKQKKDPSKKSDVPKKIIIAEKLFIFSISRLLEDNL